MIMLLAGFVTRLQLDRQDRWRGFTVRYGPGLIVSERVIRVIRVGQPLYWGITFHSSEIGS
jgi:hypothetical protein